MSLGSLLPFWASRLYQQAYSFRILRRLATDQLVVSPEALVADSIEVTLACVPQGSWNMRLFDIAILCALVKSTKAQSVLEIGTFDGRTTVNLANALPLAGQITTVDLPPSPGAAARPGARLRYAAPTKVRQIFCDSRNLSVAELGRDFDVVLIDGDHGASAVTQDTELALSVLRRGPNSFIAWDDIDYPHVLVGIRAAASRARFTYWHVSGTRIAIAFPFRADGRPVTDRAEES